MDGNLRKAWSLIITVVLAAKSHATPCKDVSKTLIYCKLGSLDDIDTSFIKSSFNGSLKIDCSSQRILSSFESKLFSHLGRLQSLDVSNCKLASISVNSFSGNYLLKDLKINSYNGDWASAIGLHLFVDSFFGLESLEKLDLSFNGLVLFPGSALCKISNLKHC